MQKNELFWDDKIQFFHYESIDSTNKRAIEYAREGGQSPALFLADKQTAGSGRLGRSFFSPDKTGIYMTLLTEVSGEEQGFTLLTALAAVCAREAIYEELGVAVEIKWVNDLYLGGKKVAGILAQSFFEGERRFVALGVGINLSTRAFPPELSDKAGSLLDTDDVDVDVCRRKIALGFCRRILEALHANDLGGYIESYRRHSCVIGRRVRFSQNGVEHCGFAKDITDMGALVIELDTGETMLLSSGEISLFI